MENKVQIPTDELKAIIHESIENSKDDIHEKIMLNVNEISFYPQIANNLKKALEERGLSMYFVDINYNRVLRDNFGKGVGVYDNDKRIVKVLKNNQFDIVAHMNGRGDIIYAENLIHLELKKYNNYSASERNKDKKRLLSTTMFPNEDSTYCLGLIINANIFESFYNAYKEEKIFAERKEKIDEHLEEIRRSNQEIFRQYQIDDLNDNEWFHNIIAGYQLGAFVDIFPDRVEITYYYSGEEWGQESLFFTAHGNFII